MIKQFKHIAVAALAVILFASTIIQCHTARKVLVVSDQPKKQYMLVVDQLIQGAQKAGESKKYESEAWMLNNAAYVLIKAHQCKLESDLTKAKECIDKAMLIKEASPACKKKIERNRQYIYFWIKKTGTVKK